MGGVEMAMTSTLTKEAQEFMTEFNAHHIERIVSFYTEDAVWEDNAVNEVYHGHQGIRDCYNGFFKMFPDIKIEIKSYFKFDDWGAREWVMTGTNKGDIPAMGGLPYTPATGKKVSFKGASILQFRNNKLYRQSDYYDFASFMRQLGVIPVGKSK
jgi:steroid delta-isomerase-like uncharacterized protein